MTTARRPHLALASAPNLRDVGGWSTADGRQVRTGAVYRAAELSKLEGEDLATFADLGLTAVYDLRTTHEVEAQPDALPEGLPTVHLDVLADATHAAPAELRRMFEDPARASEYAGNGNVERYFEQAYRDFVELPSATRSYSALLQAIADADGPVLYHCTTGKDRTGWATAVLLMLLGVPDETVLEDYLLTNTALEPMIRPWFEQFRAAGGDPDLLLPVVGVQESYLAAALDQMRASYGAVEAYVDRGLGLSPATVERLRRALLTD